MKRYLLEKQACTGKRLTLHSLKNDNEMRLDTGIHDASHLRITVPKKFRER